MTIVVHCEECDKGYKVADENEGKRFHCKKCGAIVQVPYAEEDFADDGWDEEDDWNTNDDGWDDTNEEDDWNAGDDWGDDYDDRSSRSRSSSRSGSGSRGRSRSSKKKSKDSSNKMVIFGAIGALVVLGLIVGLLFLFKGGDDGSVANFTDPGSPELPPEQAIDVSYLPGDAMVVAYLNVSRIGQTPLKSMIPEELMPMLEQGMNAEFPMSKLNTITFAMNVPKDLKGMATGNKGFLGGRFGPRSSMTSARQKGMEFGYENAVVIFRFNEPMTAEQVANLNYPGQAVKGTENIDGKSVLLIEPPPNIKAQLASAENLGVYMQDDKTFVMGSVPALKKAFSVNTSTTGPLLALLKRTHRETDCFLAVSIDGQPQTQKDLKEAVEDGIRSGKIDANDPMAKLPDNLRTAALNLNLSASSGSPLLTINLVGPDSSAVPVLEELANKMQTGIDEGLLQVRQFKSQLPDPRFEPVMDWTERLLGSFSKKATSNGVEMTLMTP